MTCAAEVQDRAVESVMSVLSVCSGPNPKSVAAPFVSPVAPVQAIAPAPAWVAPALAPDPGIARLMAAAMALCDKTGAGAKERADWCADVEAAMPEHRGDLLALVLRLMPKAMTTAVVSQALPTPAKPLPKFHSAQPWNEADKAYQAHYWQCTTCKAAARSGHSDRCATGQHLYQLYEQAFAAG